MNIYKLGTGALLALLGGFLLANVTGGASLIEQYLITKAHIGSSAYSIVHGVSLPVLDGSRNRCIFVEGPAPSEPLAVRRAASHGSRCRDYVAFSYLNTGEFNHPLTGLAAEEVAGWSSQEEVKKQSQAFQQQLIGMGLLVFIGAATTLALLHVGARCPLSRRQRLRVQALFFLIALINAALLVRQGLPLDTNLTNNTVSSNGTVQVREVLIRGVSYKKVMVRYEEVRVADIPLEYLPLEGRNVLIELSASSGELACISYDHRHDCQPAAQAQWNARVARSSEALSLAMLAALFALLLVYTTPKRS